MASTKEQNPSPFTAARKSLFPHHMQGSNHPFFTLFQAPKPQFKKGKSGQQPPRTVRPTLTTPVSKQGYGAKCAH